MVVSGTVQRDEKTIGVVSAAAVSPYLGYSIGYVRLDNPDLSPGAKVRVVCRDGATHDAKLVALPSYDK